MIVSTLICFSFYSYAVLYKIIFTTLNNNSHNLSFLRAANMHPILILILIINYIDLSYIGRSFIFSPKIFKLFTNIALVIMFMLIPLTKSNLIQLLSPNLILFNLYAIKSSSIIETLVFFELAAYTLLCLIYLSLYSENTKPNISNIFLILYMNFIGSYALYIYIVYNVYISGDLILIVRLNPIMSLCVLIKLGIGPWFVWNFSLYQNLPTKLILAYITVSFVFILPILLNLLYIDVVVRLVVFLLLAASLVVFGSRLFSRVNLNLFLLISSMCSLITLFIPYILL